MDNITPLPLTYQRMRANDYQIETGFKKLFVKANFLLKLFSWAVVFMPICHENMGLVEGERGRENIF